MNITKMPSKMRGLIHTPAVSREGGAVIPPEALLCAPELSPQSSKLFLSSISQPTLTMLLVLQTAPVSSFPNE